MTSTSTSGPGFAPRPQPPPAEMAGIARAATIIAVGNVASRLLGLVRDTTKSYYFGATGVVSAFNIAAKVPMWFYDLLAGGMVSSALVPVFSEYARPDAQRRAELWQIVSFLLTITVIGLSAFTLLGELLAPQIAVLLGGGLSEQTLALTVSLLRITLPAMLFLNLAGILAGLLYALKRFTLPAFNAAIFNLGIVVATVLFARPFGVTAMAAGLLLGAILQVALLLPGLHNSHLRIVFDWQHPAVRRIARLYLPIVLGLLVDMVSRAISYRLASSTGDQSIAWMDYATTLMQFPLGLTSTAIAVAILPTLARQATDPDPRVAKDDFLSTLAQGLKLVIVLIIPATVGLFLLARPIVELIFEHGDFLARDTTMVTLVLRYYLLGLVAAAVDLPLVNAFYARQDAWTPAMVGLVGVFIYLGAALAPSLFRSMRLTDLIAANAIQLIYHALIMWMLLRRRVGDLRGQRLGETVGKAAFGSALMLVSAWGGLLLVQAIPLPGRFLTEVAAVVVPGALGAIVYFGVLLRMNVPETQFVLALVRRRN